MDQDAVEFTARQVKISKILKTGALEGIERIELVLGKITAAGLTFRAERHLQIVEIVLKCRNHSVVAKGEAASQTSALRVALEHAEHQAHRYRDRTRARKRQPNAEKAPEPAPAKTPRVSARKAAVAAAEEKAAVARDPGKRMKAAITVHSFPGRQTVVEPHILSAAEAIAISPMTIEQAVKEAEFRDRDLLIFRDPAGELFVLHRRRDGKMELVEVP
jgi:putative sigma-54 modulation protein